MISNYNIKEDELVFSLDIGTRTVMGILGFQKNTDFVVIATATVEHESRAMIDGQVHDISKVANAVLKVKNSLEKKVGIELKEVAIAAAGRVLKTYLTKVWQDLDEEKEIQKDTIKGLELKGIDDAQLKLKEDLNNADIEYFCVGYSVVNYYLNDYIITNLEGHKAKKIGADVLATFLPKIVVDSLYAVMEKVGLEVANLTLEPIAAINVAIPENLRLLNLALVDIGAGTSDIAITREGTVIGYGMIPIAGDEITEKIIHKYLVDFQTAEKIKFQTENKKEISFLDILGLPHTVSCDEVLEIIEPAVNRLAEEISTKIYAVNGNKPPNAVFCVGGGSQTYGLTEKIADNLKIPRERVAVRGGKSLINVVYECEPLEYPDVITPIGICVTSIIQKGYDFIEVKVNKEVVKLLNTKKLTLMDAGLQKGFDHTNLLGRKGDSIIFRLNRQRKKVWGESAIPAELYINGKEASLDTLIHSGDDILIQAAVNGNKAIAFIKDYISEINPKQVKVNEMDMELPVTCILNGQVVDKDTQIHNDDEVEILEVDTIRDLAKYADISLENKIIFANDVEVDAAYIIKDGDRIEFEVEKEDRAFFLDAIKNENTKNTIRVKVNNEDVVMNGNKKEYIFVDVFNFIDFDLKNPQGNVVLKLNGRRAAFTDVINQGDNIDIYWDKTNKSNRMENI